MSGLITYQPSDELFSGNRPVRSARFNQAKNFVSSQQSKILQRVARADNSAIDECLSVYGGLVWSAAKKYTDSPEAAETATREIFQDIWQYAEYFDEAQNSERNFILLIASKHLGKCCENIV